MGAKTSAINTILVALRPNPGGFVRKKAAVRMDLSIILILKRN
jgi:hypothetical protein